MALIASTIRGLMMALPTASSSFLIETRASGYLAKIMRRMSLVSPPTAAHLSMSIATVNSELFLWRITGVSSTISSHRANFCFLQVSGVVQDGSMVSAGCCVLQNA